MNELKKSILVSLWFMFLTFPIMVIRVNTVDNVVVWRWENMALIGNLARVERKFLFFGGKQLHPARNLDPALFTAVDRRAATMIGAVNSMSRAMPTGSSSIATKYRYCVMATPSTP